MGKAKTAAVNDVSRSQAQRLLDLARARQAGKSGQDLAQAMDKGTLRQNARKKAKGGIGGGAEGA